MRFNGKSYDNVQFTSIGENKERGWSHDCLRIALNVMFTQMSAKKGITLFKDHAFAATVKEYKQLDGMDVMGPENPNVITPQKKQKELRAVNHIKEKRCGNIKGNRGGKCPGKTLHHQLYP